MLIGVQKPAAEMFDCGLAKYVLRERAEVDYGDGFIKKKFRPDRLPVYRR
jgi:hypothetical protein